MKIDSNTTLLIVEDDPTLAFAYQEYLRDESCVVHLVDTGEEALDVIQHHLPDAILLDLSLPDMNGMEILKYINHRQLPCAVVIVTAHGTVDKAVEAMRHQAFDFIEKPFNASRLIVTLRNALRYQNLLHTVQIYRENYERQQFHNLIGASLSMQTVYKTIENAAPSKATIFIMGESGTGKELCAEAIHKQSPRQNQPFIALNCAAIPKDLMESEIFGHVKGAFSGALKEREGAAALAHEGTLFLDEICDMDLDLQGKLLRFIQTGTVQKVGGSRSEKVDIRFICATNRDPLEEVQQGRFREDLYYRLHVIPVILPPLRHREGDVLLIAREFLKRFAAQENKSFSQFSPEVEAILLYYDWPGNVRQLQNIIHNIVVLNEGEVVNLDMLPTPLNQIHLPQQTSIKVNNHKVSAESDTDKPTSETTTEMPTDLSHASVAEDFSNVNQVKPLWQVEKEVIEKTITLCDGNIPKAAALLEISPSTIYRKRQGWKNEGLPLAE